MGTVPTGTGECSMTSFLMASMSPPVERSMTVSAPASTATLSLQSSISGSLRSFEVPRLAFVLVLRPRPMASGTMLV